MPGTPDRIAGIHHVVGGAGDDVLRGDAGGNVLYGGAGDDALEGRDGPDRLVGGSGFDAFAAGPGDDTVDALNNRLFASIVGDFVSDGLSDAASEPIDCGAGRDAVEAIDADLVRPDCEGGAATARPPIVFPAVSRDGRRARFALPCTLLDRKGGCSGRIRIVAPRSGRASGRSFRIPRRGGVVGVPLPFRLPPGGAPTEIRLVVIIAFVRSYGPSGIRYTLWLPAGCAAPTRCGATTATS